MYSTASYKRWSAFTLSVYWKLKIYFSGGPVGWEYSYYSVTKYAVPLIQLLSIYLLWYWVLSVASVEGYLLPTWAWKRIANVSTEWSGHHTFALITTGIFSWNISKLFSELKLVTDNLLQKPLKVLSIAKVAECTSPGISLPFYTRNKERG